MTPLSHFDIRKALDAEIIRLLPAMGITQREVAWPNAKLNLADVNSGYLRVFIMPGQTFPATLGPDCFVRLLGVYQISIFQPKDTGIGEAERWAGIILNEFPLGRVLAYCGHEIVINQVYCSAAVEDEDYLLLPVSLAYYCHVQQFQNSAR